MRSNTQSYSNLKTRSSGLRSVATQPMGSRYFQQNRIRFHDRGNIITTHPPSNAYVTVQSAPHRKLQLHIAKLHLACSSCCPAIKVKQQYPEPKRRRRNRKKTQDNTNNTQRKQNASTYPVSPRFSGRPNMASHHLRDPTHVMHACNAPRNLWPSSHRVPEQKSRRQLHHVAVCVHMA